VRELGAFGAVGATALLIDLGLFQLLYANLGVGAVTSKVLSGLVGMTVAFFGHRIWSFGHSPRRDPARQYLLFAAVNGGTLSLSAAIVAVVRYPLDQEGVLTIQLVNLGTVGLITVLRYLAYRTWVFPAQRRLDPPAPRTPAPAQAVESVA